MNGKARKALYVMRYQDDINTEHNMKSVCRAAVAHWTRRLTRNGQKRVRNWKGIICTKVIFETLQQGCPLANASGA